MVEIPDVQITVHPTDIFIATVAISKTGQALLTLPRGFVRRYDVKQRDKVTLIFIKNDHS